MEVQKGITMANKLLALVDDRATNFWTGKPLWNSDHWNGYKLLLLDGDSVGSINDVHEKLRVVEHSIELFVVTDGHLWNDPKGGAKVLLDAKSNRAFRRGVVYSDDPQLCGELSHADNIIALTRTPESERIQQIKDFFEKGRKPEEFERSEASRRLSAAIHGLENLAIPIRIDAETLNPTNSGGATLSEDMVNDIHGDYFGPDGYLTKEKVFLNGNGIENEIAAVLGPLITVERKTLAQILDGFLTGGRVDPTKAEKRLKIKEARDDTDSCHVAETLRDRLAAISEAIRGLAERLRNIRDAEEKFKNNAS
jgi:hypothetical protein